MEKYWIWFKLINIEYIKKIQILNEYIDIEKIYCLNSNKLKHKFNLNKFEIDSFMDISIRKRANEIDKYNKENNIGIINIFDNVYPYLLTKIYNPPILLYYKGDKEILNKKALNIFIGKSIDSYGKNILSRLCEKLYENDFSIIYGLEKLDGYSNIRNSSIIVLANGIKNNMNIKNGIIVSEYEYDVIWSKDNVLNRNRILTGLSNNTLLIQVYSSDGANYIIDSALEQGRDVSVVPGDIFSDNNKLTNEVIKEGARVITDINELLVYEHS